MRRRILAVACGVIVPAITLWFVGSAYAQIPASEQLSVARSLLPDEARDGVEFVVPLTGGETVYQEGEGNWICRGDRPDDDRLTLSCYTRQAAPFLDRQRELIARGIRGAEMRAVLDEEARAGVLPLPSYGLEISASGALGANGELPDELNLYYLLYIPFATAASIGVPDVQPDDPTVPFLHQAGSHESHIMWMRTVSLSMAGAVQRR